MTDEKNQSSDGKKPDGAFDINQSDRKDEKKDKDSENDVKGNVFRVNKDQDKGNDK